MRAGIDVREGSASLPYASICFSNSSRFALSRFCWKVKFSGAPRRSKQSGTAAGSRSACTYIPFGACSCVASISALRTERTHHLRVRAMVGLSLHACLRIQPPEMIHSNVIAMVCVRTLRKAARDAADLDERRQVPDRSHTARRPASSARDGLIMVAAGTASGVSRRSCACSGWSGAACPVLHALQTTVCAYDVNAERSARAAQ